MDWDRFREAVKDVSYKPLLVISSDIKVLERVHIEDLNYPQSVISAVTRFHNSVRELYECINSINSERFCSISSEMRLRMIDLCISVVSKTDKHADFAIESIRSELPTKWFKNID